MLREHLVDGGRVVILASRAHYRAKGIDWDALTQPTATVTGYPEYGVSKLANVLHARRLALELELRNITVFVLHPGVVASNIWRKVPWPFRGLAKRFMLSNEEGARTSLFCATAPQLSGNSGKYWDLCKEKEVAKLAQDDALMNELWRRSEEWVAAK